MASGSQHRIQAPKIPTTPLFTTTSFRDRFSQPCSHLLSGSLFSSSPNDIPAYYGGQENVSTETRTQCLFVSPD